MQDNNPYQPPQVDPSLPVAASDLAAIAPLRGQIRVLRIIVIALAIGVVVFGIFAIVNHAGPQTFGKLDTVGWVMLGFGLLVGIQGIVLPGILFRYVARPSPEMVSQFSQHGPEVARVLIIQSRIQMATIVGCALFEGGAFANLAWYMTTGELTHLAMSGLLLLGILARFPLPGACERRIAEELRRQSEEASFQPVAIDRPRQV